QTRKRFPKEGRVLRTALGAERVLAVDVFRETVTLRTDGGDTRVVSLEKLKGEVSGADAEVLPDDGDRLLERRAAPGARAREDRRRLHCALSPVARGRRPLPDGNGRAQP